MSLSTLSIKRPVLTIVLNLTIILFGIIGYTFLGVREFPSIDPAQISIRTDYAGANADIIESQITEPIEKSINSIDGIKNITSSSVQGTSTITVEFNLNKVESSAVFTAEGTFKELEQEIKLTELPKSASDYCTKNYAGWKLSEAAKITDAAGTVMFEAEMEKGKEHFDVMFDDKGNFVKKGELEKESDKEKKD